jgi:hypothetical protein
MPNVPRPTAWRSVVNPCHLSVPVQGAQPGVTEGPGDAGQNLRVSQGVGGVENADHVITGVTDATLPGPECALLVVAEDNGQALAVWENASRGAIVAGAPQTAPA